MIYSAIANQDTLYSVKTSSGETGASDWTYEWKFIGVSENLGVFTSAINQHFVTVQWLTPTEENQYEYRELSCDVYVPGADCAQTIILQVSVTTNESVLTAEITGIEGHTTSYTGYVADGISGVIGPVKLTNQCHIEGNLLDLVAQGDSGVYDFLWSTNTPYQSNISGYFVGTDGIQNLGASNHFLVDGTYKSESTLKIISTSPPTPPSNGKYYVSAIAMDESGINSSVPQYLSLKIVPAIPQISTNSYNSTVTYIGSMTEDYYPIYFNWTLKDTNRYPEWFKMKAYLEIGEITCGTNWTLSATGSHIYSNQPCLGLTTGNYTGVYWNSGTAIEVLNDYIYNLNSSTDLTFGYTVAIPGFFGTGWAPGSPDKYKLCLHTYFVDEEENGNTGITGPCLVQAPDLCMTVNMEYCVGAPIELTPSLVGPICPTGIPLTNIQLHTTMPTITCPDSRPYYNERTHTCETAPIWQPCVTGGAYPGTYWNGTECDCPPGFELGYTGYVPTGYTMCLPVLCPTGSTMVGDVCQCTETGMTMDINTRECECDENAAWTPCLTCSVVSTNAVYTGDCYTMDCSQVYTRLIGTSSVNCYYPSQYWSYNILEDYYLDYNNRRYRMFNNTNAPAVVATGDTIYYSSTVGNFVDLNYDPPQAKSSVIGGVSGDTYIPPQFVTISGLLYPSV